MINFTESVCSKKTQLKKRSGHLCNIFIPQRIMIIHDTGHSYLYTAINEKPVGSLTSDSNQRRV